MGMEFNPLQDRGEGVARQPVEVDPVGLSDPLPISIPNLEEEVSLTT